jgi:Zn-finger in ubiquitin-hydrolases and other protein.
MDIFICLYAIYIFICIIINNNIFKNLLQALACFCHMCNNIGSRLHSCLHCVFFGCYVGGHIQEHAKLKKHFLGMEKEKYSCVI